MPQETTFLKLKKILKGERSWGAFLNSNFDKIDSEIKSVIDKNSDQETRISNIVAGAGTGNTEIVDSRQSLVKGKTFPVLRNRLEENEAEMLLALGFLQSESKNLNTDLGMYTLIEYRDTSGNLRITSEIQTLDSNNRYTFREVKVYEPDGLTVRKSQKLALEYDINGKLFKEKA